MDRGVKDEFGIIVHCNSLDADIKGVRVMEYPRGNTVPTGLMEEYVRRLNGRTVQEDLELAGIWRDHDFGTDYVSRYFSWDSKTREHSYIDCAHGLAFNGSVSGNVYKVDLIRPDNAQILKGQKTYNGGSSFSVWDYPEQKQWFMPVIWFSFA